MPFQAQEELLKYCFLTPHSSLIPTVIQKKCTPFFITKIYTTGCSRQAKLMLPEVWGNVSSGETSVHLCLVGRAGVVFFFKCRRQLKEGESGEGHERN